MLSGVGKPEQGVEGGRERRVALVQRRGGGFGDLRHAHATFALRQGESVLAIARLLGHASPHTTLKYIHLADSMVREAVETVGAVLEG